MIDILIFIITIHGMSIKKEQFGSGTQVYKSVMLFGKFATRHDHLINRVGGG